MDKKVIREVLDLQRFYKSRVNVLQFRDIFYPGREYDFFLCEDHKNFMDDPVQYIVVNDLIEIAVKYYRKNGLRKKSQ